MNDFEKQVNEVIKILDSANFALNKLQSSLKGELKDFFDELEKLKFENDDLKKGNEVLIQESRIHREKNELLKRIIDRLNKVIYN